MNCMACGDRLDQILEGCGLHMGCTDPIAEQVKTEITEIIRWAAGNSPRSLQQLPGPSELGEPCDRRLAYRLSGSPTFNTKPDPLAGVVGTGLHAWLEQAIKQFNEATGDNTLVPETRLQIDPLIGGTSDLYHRQLQAVIDYKGASTDVIKEAIINGPSQGYRVQAQLYGLGYENAGLPVKRVMIVYIPRAGSLKSVHVWQAPYTPQIALDALARIYKLGADLVELGDDPARFEKIPATPSAKSCWFCPFSGRDLLLGATIEYGCPGK